jgi:transcriptional/translational regulatory protein YebC/TACO1
MFTKKGLIAVSTEACEEDRLMEIVLEGGAEDLIAADDVFEILCQPEDFESVRAALENNQVPAVSAEVTMIPKTTVKVEGKQAEQVLKLMEALEDSDDVQQVYANFDIDEEQGAVD